MSLHNRSVKGRCGPAAPAGVAAAARREQYAAAAPSMSKSSGHARPSVPLMTGAGTAAAAETGPPRPRRLSWDPLDVPRLQKQQHLTLQFSRRPSGGAAAAVSFVMRMVSRKTLTGAVGLWGVSVDGGPGLLSCV